MKREELEQEILKQESFIEEEQRCLNFCFSALGLQYPLRKRDSAFSVIPKPHFPLWDNCIT